MFAVRNAYKRLLVSADCSPDFSRALEGLLTPALQGHACGVYKLAEIWLRLQDLEASDSPLTHVTLGSG